MYFMLKVCSTHDNACLVYVYLGVTDPNGRRPKAEASIFILFFPAPSKSKSSQIKSLNPPLRIPIYLPITYPSMRIFTNYCIGNF